MANREHLSVVMEGLDALVQWLEIHPETVLDLEGADLSGIDLRGARIKDVNLKRANLTGAKLSKANLAGGDLTEADFTDADMAGISIAGAACFRANFSSLRRCSGSWAMLISSGMASGGRSGAAGGGMASRLLAV